MSFRMTGLDPELFADLHALADAALAQQGIQRLRVTKAPAAPCRITLDDAEIGESVLLLSFDHQPAETPYRQQGPIFIRETPRRFSQTGVIAPALARRPLSLRGYDEGHMMIEAELCDGAHAPAMIERLFDNRDVAYIHAHYARRGCYAALIERA
jgi:hypothetical protein